MNEIPPPEKSVYSLAELLQIIRRLRRDCPWDRRQTHHSLKPFLLEETYETLEAIDSEQWNHLAGELGDLLLQILLHAEIASESERFDFSVVVDKISKKLIERHPHVFGETKFESEKEFKENWEHSKKESENRKSLLSGVPDTLPALFRAQRLQEKAATVGFEWESLAPVLNKFEEEWQEFKEALHSKNHEEQKAEFGDLHFSLVNLSRYLSINSEEALQATNRKFIKRFQYIERQYKNDPKAMKAASLEELDKFWIEAKNSKK